MSLAGMRPLVLPVIVALFCPLVTLAQGISNAVPSQKGVQGVRCCGLLLRTDFGHPERMIELSIKPEAALMNTLPSTTVEDLLTSYEAYLIDLNAEFGEPEKRDVLRSRMADEFRAASKDKNRAALTIEGIRQYNLGRTLLHRQLKNKSLEELKKSHHTLAKASPANSFILMYVDTFLANALTDSGNPTEGLAVAQSVAKRALAEYGDKDDYVAFCLAALAKAQIALGKGPQAEKTTRQMMIILADSLELQPNNYYYYVAQLAEAYAMQSKHAEVAEVTAYLEPELRKFVNDDNDDFVLKAVALRVKALAGLERFDEAEKVLKDYPKTIPALRDPGQGGRQVLEAAVQLYEKQGRQKQAVAMQKSVDRVVAKIEKNADLNR